MKPITLHPVSVLVGAALVGLSLVLSGATQSPAVTHHPRTEVVGQIPAKWWTHVVLTTSGGIPGESFTVPAGQFFVVTLAIVDNNGVYLNGQYDASFLAVKTDLPGYVHSFGVGGLDRNGTRVVYPPGTLLTAGSVDTVAHLWGYLEPVR